MDGNVEDIRWSLRWVASGHIGAGYGVPVGLCDIEEASTRSVCGEGVPRLVFAIPVPCCNRGQGLGLEDHVDFLGVEFFLWGPVHCVYMLRLVCNEDLYPKRLHRVQL